MAASYTINVTNVSTGSTAVYSSQFSLGAQVVVFGTAAPEPSTMMFCGVGFLALAWGEPAAVHRLGQANHG